MLMSLQRLASGIGVDEQIEWVGVLEEHEVARRLSRAEVYVSTSPTDGTSLSLLEAMACGTLPVVADTDANRPWIEEGVTGSLFQPGDPQDLAEKILKALHSGEFRDSAREKNRLVIEQKADWHRNMGEMERLYQRLKVP